jgi:hypothetical protein
MNNVLSRRAKTIADEALLRSVHNGGGGGGITQLTGEVMAGPGSGAQVATVAGGYEGALYVTPTGNDTTGNGTIYKPYATISKALLEAATGASIATPATVLVGAGTYAESLLLPPSVTVIGIDPSQTVAITGDVSLSSGWTGLSDQEQTGLSNIFVEGTTTIDWAAQSQDSGIVFFFNCSIEAISATGLGTDNEVVFVACFISGLGTFTSVEMSTQSCAFSAGVALASTVSHPAEYLSNGDSITPTFSVTSPSGGDECTFIGLGTAVAGTLTINGANTSYTTSADGIPLTVTQLNGAPAPIISSGGAGATVYTPTVPGNWAGSPPTTVQQALDRIAANTSNTHPIP